MSARDLRANDSEIDNGFSIVDEGANHSDVEITEISVPVDKEENDFTPPEDEKESKSINYVVPVLETRPPNYMWLALCTTIFFNPLSGIVALVLAMQADAEYMGNRYEQARRLGRVVKIVCIVSICITVLVLVIVSIFFVNPPVRDDEHNT